ncbi:cysteine dioxygenase [Jatrophihabitans sp.]|uniref:cysteine dioxygenase n=1 Tax=Jatrophihabitans sp. TaxID=1932789 RepID=UPI002C1B7764|nr:cysteine dioxygenase family protein [Jatrophihabitans sp.]
MNAFRRPSGSFSRAGIPLTPAELLQYATFAAAEVRGGRYLVAYDQAHRWHQRLYRDRRLDLWLISWLPSQGTQLHDHGGSAGAFTVLTGTLAEAIARPAGPGSGPALLERRREAGSGVAFGAHYVHDVRNLSGSPAVSVHAYSPPLASMNFYDLDATDGLRLLASVPTDDPEPELPGAARNTSAA